MLAGEDDILITPTESRILNDKIFNSKMVLVSGAGHTPHVENREEFSQKVIEFLC